MSNVVIRLFTVMVALWGWGAGGALAQTSPPERLPISAFFEPAALQAAHLSPSGRWLLARVQQPDQRAKLVLMDLEDKEPAKVLAQFTAVDVTWFRWLHEDLILFATANDLDGARQYRNPALLSVQRDGNEMRLLVKPKLDNLFPARGGVQPLEANHYFLAPAAWGSDEIIVGEQVFDAAYEVQAVRPVVLNARTMVRRSLLKTMPENAQGWGFDRQGRARVAVAYHEKETSFHWHDLATGNWREIGRFPNLELMFSPSFVDQKGELFVQGNTGPAGTAELHRFDLATGKRSPDLVANTPGFSGDITPVFDEASGTLVGLSMLTDTHATAWLVPAMQAVQAKVDAALPGRANELQCRPCDQPKVVLVHSSADRVPGDFLIYRPAEDKWQRIGSARPRIDPQQMARTELLRTKARDGHDLPVWITHPVGPAGKPRAAVVLVHGGPWLRGAQWEWDDEAQFLASRGYVVIQPEFRGSTGYGYDHFRAGWKQWGQAMQDDVSDALKFAAKRANVDLSRVCIAGASYGGYATLMGLAKDPAQYRCGVAWVGVTDARLMYSVHWSDIDSEAKNYSYPQLIGDPVADAAMLAANSPIELAGRIKAPVLLAYGANDMRVPLEHGERMRAALRKAGQEPEWVVYDNERHGWRQMKTRLDFWGRVETFLARHLAP